jgi:hypothetical protein
MKQLLIFGWLAYCMVYIPYSLYRDTKIETASHFKAWGRYPRIGFNVQSPGNAAISGIFIGAFVCVIGFGIANWIIEVMQ